MILRAMCLRNVHNYRMLRPRTKTLFFFLLLMSFSSLSVHAETKIYQYDGKLPFVQMMLNMMVAMGVIDRLPANGPYGGYGFSGYPSRYSSPYARALAMRGISPGSSFYRNPYLGNSQLSSPFVRSPWLQSPWSLSGLNDTVYDSPLWGSPSWGVLPTEGYAPYDSFWSSSDLDGWVNEPWEISEWNDRAEYLAQKKQAAQPSVPLVQNFNYNVPASPAESNKDSANVSSPLSKLGAAEPSAAEPVPQSRKQSPLRKKTRQKPCITEFCGLKKPNLNGLWVSQSGEMLGVKNDRYLWSDGHSRYLAGQIKIQNEYLLANVDDHDQLMRFKYKLAGNHLLTMQPDGTIREFTRMPKDQYVDQYLGDGRGYGQNYASPYYR